MARDFYDVLDVSRDAGSEEIQQAFRRLARANHPDINRDPAAEERFKEINEAYRVLSDPEERRKYDRFGEDFRKVPDDWEQTVGAGVGGRARGGPRYGPASGVSSADFDDLGGGIDLEDLLGGMFGRGRARSGPIAGADQEVELPLTVEEAFRGGPRQVTLTGTDGPRSYTVTIPPGVTDGQRIRLAGEGGRGVGGGDPGDLYMVTRLLPHPLFRVSGRDISVDLPLAAWEAALGGSVPVPTPAGGTKVEVPPGSSTGRRLRLRGQGMPNPRGAPGDLFAEVEVMVPPRPTDAERDLFARLAEVSDFDPRRDTRRGQP
ncbi:J domain-containing protein [Actinomycetospora lemnae]|uniref:J domain-containing protein n=1 Tax=Actinomycetospora lemnae TaxID=3019891 RepID=A0ABT5T2D7_9PSEU|nr:J domain-containing protein [Actinomycetospora sp. DW7H6]MDD7968103.1 J domain-containing protein [Actinomycetospora sp. DW7H6]